MTSARSLIYYQGFHYLDRHSYNDGVNKSLFFVEYDSYLLKINDDDVSVTS